MTHEEVNKLMQAWNLTGIDAILFPCEKNKGVFASQFKSSNSKLLKTMLK